MSKKKQIGLLAEQYYIQDGDTLDKISKATGVCTKTLSRWKADGNWDAKRAEYLESGIGINQNINALIAAEVRKLNKADGTIDVSKIDALSKLSKIAQTMKQSVSMYQATTMVMREFIEFIHSEVADESIREELSGIIQRFQYWIEKRYTK